MGKHCVLFTRVSTEKQTLDAQSKELREFAISDGYSEDEIYEIAEKESARKRGKIDAYGREEDRRGIKKLKELVESDSSINALYVWELSRLGRRQKVIMDLREFCIDRHINIVVKTPSIIRLLNEKGEIDQASDMVFTLFSSWAESEMRIKLERFHRTKVQHASIGKHSGSTRPMFGYTLDENNFYIIDETEAKVVRLIFEKCIEGMSMTQISKFLNQIGIKKTPHLVRHILTSKAYTGEQVNFRPSRQKEPITRKYPIIISQTTWQKAVQARKEHQTSVPKGRIYYCRGLIICPSCGRPLVANSAPGTCAYRCGRYTIRYQTLGDMSAQPKCKGGQSININAMDSITWTLVSEVLYPKFITEKNESRKKKLRKEISEVQKKIDALEKRYTEIDESVARLAEQYIMHNISKSHHEVLQARILEKKGEVDADKIRFTEQLDTLTRMLDTTNKETKVPWLRVRSFHEAQEVAREITDDQTRYDICHTVLRKIKLENTDPSEKGYGRKRIEFLDYSQQVYWCEYHVRKKRPELVKFCTVEDGVETFAYIPFKYLERFRRSK